MERRAAFTAVYEAEAERLRRWLRSKLASEQTAEDIAEESFARLWEHWDEVGGENPAAWTWTVARRLLVSQYRRHGESVWLPPWLPEADGEWQARAEDRADLARVWGFLTEKQAHVLELHFEEGWTYPEIAGPLGVSDEGARGLAQRGWHTLKRWLSTS